MAKKDKKIATESTAQVSDVATTEVSTELANGSEAVNGEADGVAEAVTGTHTFNPAIKTDAQLMADAKAAQKAKDDEAKKAKADAKAAKKAEADKAKAEKAAARAEAKTAREARISELAASGKNYVGSMLALADRVKQGVYVKGASGQLRSTDELALALDGVGPTDVIKLGLDVLKQEDNPYAALNIGQQSMNLRNRMRGAIKKGTLTLAEIKEYLTRNGIHVTSAADIEKREAEKAQRKADREAKAKAAAEAKAAKPVSAASVEAAPEPEAEQVEETEDENEKVAAE